MDILLIRPKPDKKTIGLQNVMICEPLELEYIGAYVEPMGHKVTIIDMILEKKPLSYYIKKHNPNIVGITSYIAHVNVVKNYAKEIKQVNPSCKVAIGGVHAEVVPEDFEDDNIDYIVASNGLKTFAEVLTSLNNNDNRKISGVWNDGYQLCTKETTFNYPHPNRRLVEKYRNRYYYMFHNPCALMKTSYGCPYQCNFCFCRKITDGKYFTRDLEDIIEEIKLISEREIYIVDDDFLVDRNRILKFFRLLKENNLNKKFLIYARADFIAENEDIIDKFSKIGLRAVIVGLESSNEEELKKYNKKSNVEINEKAINILKRYNVECYGTLILGVDWDDNDFNRLYKWIRKIDIKFINLQPFTPIPGTELYEEYKDKLIIPRNESEKWDLAHLTVQPSKISIRRYYWNIIKLYYKVTMNPRNLIKMIREYGIRENLKLSVGASNITIQYFIKMFRN
ncbi:cobalamin B12-binding domain-containing protein [Sedimentibacter hydroxybenzoicus DSM 7310]|uniref:Cobalamin B12-binding domain-containing protein n=1 Tax=Sedimentibacter hydroxybenzoicus DSM 7310 TaxID=1123245 RepID=A0A974GVD2_SEDHY|nr:radical SAM protein [Sedimentibacter hydroxybenzoicus]NYB73252.1 cobalamin B12-binding domain-containing protein [Sedimentibacter hydroxybenzoicus DSM 7310]